MNGIICMLISTYSNSLSHLFDRPSITKHFKIFFVNFFQFIDVVVAEHGKVLGSQLVRTHLKYLDQTEESKNLMWAENNSFRPPLFLRAGFLLSELVSSPLAAPASTSLPPRRDSQNAKSRSDGRCTGSTGTMLASNGCPTW